MYESGIKYLVNIFVHWMITYIIMGTSSSRRNLNHLSWIKVIRNVPFDVDLMRMIILKIMPECFSGIY
jgi:hypothetical protein